MSYAIRNGKLVKNAAPSTAPRPIQTNPAWAQGSISVVANDHDCFSWQGTYQDAVELIKLSGKTPPAIPAHADERRLLFEPMLAPRWPIDAAEAEAMMKMMTVTTDITNPLAMLDGPKTYVGYTDDELCRGKPAVRIR
jgi:hypothetical protein